MSQVLTLQLSILNAGLCRLLYYFFIREDHAFVRPRGVQLFLLAPENVCTVGLRLKLLFKIKVEINGRQPIGPDCILNSNSYSIKQSHSDVSSCNSKVHFFVLINSCEDRVMELSGSYTSRSLGNSLCILCTFPVSLAGCWSNSYPGG